jgi:chromosome segregation ATPase
MSVVGAGGSMVGGGSSVLPVDAIYRAMMDPEEFKRIADRANSIMDEAVRGAAAIRESAAIDLAQAKNDIAKAREEASGIIAEARATADEIAKSSQEAVAVALAELAAARETKAGLEAEIEKLAKTRADLKSVVDAAFEEREALVAERERLNAIEDQRLEAEKQECDRASAVSKAALEKAQQIVREIRASIEAWEK